MMTYDEGVDILINHGILDITIYHAGGPTEIYCEVVSNRLSEMLGSPVNYAGQVDREKYRFHAPSFMTNEKAAAALLKEEDVL